MADDRDNGSKLRESDRGRRDREKGSSSGRRHSRSRSRDRKHKRDNERRSSRERDRVSGRKRSRSRSRSREAKRRREDGDRPRESNGDNTGNGADNKMDVDDRSESENSRKPVEPISLEDLLKQKQEEEAQEAKPVFLTKQQRRELALKRREAEAAEKRRQQEEQRQLREQELTKAREEERTKDRRDRDDRDRRRDDRDDRGKGKDEREKEKQLEQIKMTYLGYKKPKKKVVKITDKTKPEEDWDLTEDTSRTINLPGAVDTNPLFTTKTEFRPVFGRGFFGGIDPSEQLKKFKEGLEHEKDSKKLRQKETEREDLDKKIKKYQGDLVPAKHWSDKSTSEMTQRDWRIFREDHNISTKGGGIPVPIRSWEEANLPGWLKEAIADAKYKKPTAIQMQSIPIGLQRRDIIGVAETGSGKTAAFLIPMLVYISSLPAATDTDGPYALVMAPTRELAIQIENEAAKFAKHFRIRTACLVGGQSIEEQGLQLRKGVEIVIATPGRLVDCLENHYLVLSVCNYVVLDEADRMIDMGFEESLLKVLDAMPSSSWKSENEEEAEKQEKDTHQAYRTTIMFSATMPPPVERIAKKYLRRPAVIYIGEVGRTVDRIKQVVAFVKGDADKKRQLEGLLTNGPKPPIIVFVNQKKTADALAKSINKLGFRATTLHSGRSQDQREWALEEFREGRFDVLVATDVAGRGLDVKGITHVINYDMPTTIEAYTHRIGRTGRAGESGLATSFMTGDDTDIMYDLKAQLTKTNNAIPNELRDHPSAQVKPMVTKPVVMQD